jgi:predicted nucleotidyltransferase component of viral defense system
LLTRAQLRGMHGRGLPLHVLELDYIESIVLKGMFRQGDALAFKGGTCLRKAYGLDRFSEDLDFSLMNDMSPVDVRKELEKGRQQLERNGINARVTGWSQRKRIFLARLTYEGPLFTGNPATRGNMEVEIHMERTLEPPEWRSIATGYADAGVYTIQCMRINEILAEKFRTLNQRHKPRDLYDVWFLSMRGIRTDLDTVNHKIAPARVESLSKILGEYAVTEMEWKRDLTPLLENPPRLDTVISDLKRFLR